MDASRQRTFNEFFARILEIPATVRHSLSTVIWCDKKCSMSLDCALNRECGSCVSIVAQGNLIVYSPLTLIKEIPVSLWVMDDLGSCIWDNTTCPVLRCYKKIVSPWTIGVQLGCR